MLSASLAGAQPHVAHLRGAVVDENGAPVQNVEVVLQPANGQTQTVYADAAGRFEFSALASDEYRLSLSKSGFFHISQQPVQIKEGDNEISVVLNHETELHENMEVSSTAQVINPLDTAHEEALAAREIRDIPVPAAHDLEYSLPALPQVVRDNSGLLHVAGGRAGETQYILDGFDIGDPVTGELTVRINVDSVRVAEIETGRYATQYGRGGVGTLTVDTLVGDNQWRENMTDFIPGVNVDSGVRFGNWYPRFTVSGPLQTGHAWFSEALSVQHTLSVIKDLPQNADATSQWSGDNLLRAQVNLNSSNLLQGCFLYNRQDASNLGLGPFAPVETTTSFLAQRSFFAVKDQILTKRTFYELGIAADLGHSDSTPQGSLPYLVTPTGAAGNYFEALRQKTRRWQAIANAAMPSRRWHGMHELKFGFDASSVAWSQSASRSSIQVLSSDNILIQNTTFSGPRQFRTSDAFVGGYGQDTWRIAKALVFQYGVRNDWDRFLHHRILSPRVSANFLPFREDRGKLTVAWGVFVQPIALAIFSPALDQQRTDAFYDPTGTTPVAGPVISRFVLPSGGLEQPRFYTTSIGWEQKFGHNSLASVNFSDRNEHSGLAYEKVLSDQDSNVFLLQTNRRDRYRSVEITARHAFPGDREISGSYTRSSARTNEALDYSLATIVFSPQQPGPLAWDAPNRFISSGWAPAPVWNLTLSYFLEYRTGYPFSVINQDQELIGPPNSLRFPDYLSLNLGIEKRLRLFRKTWAARLTVINVSGHKNPDSVINNIDASDFMNFAGGQGRAFSGRIRMVQ